MPENKSCENCGRECEDQLKNGACSKWVYVNEKSVDPRGENYHKGPEIENAAEKRGAEKERVRIVKMLSTTPDGFSEEKYDGWREALACIIRSDKKLDEIYNSCRVATAEKRGAGKERERINLAIKEVILGLNAVLASKGKLTYDKGFNRCAEVTISQLNVILEKGELV
jgi:hypothetical protein